MGGRAGAYLADFGQRRGSLWTRHQFTLLPDVGCKKFIQKKKTKEFDRAVKLKSLFQGVIWQMTKLCYSNRNFPQLSDLVLKGNAYQCEYFFNVSSGLNLFTVIQSRN